MYFTGIRREIYTISEGSQLFSARGGRSRSVTDRTHSSQISLGPLSIESYSKRVIINVRGHKYETWEETLAVFPGTLLGCPDKRQKYYSFDSREYIFDNDKDSFDAILFYYQSGGILSKPYNVERQIFEKELEFFEIDDAFDRRNRFEKEVQKETKIETPLPSGVFRKRIWMLFEHPTSSKLAKYLGYWSFLIILLSVAGLCADTVPNFKVRADIITKNLTMNNSWRLINVTVERLDHWFVLECVSVSWFTVEYFFRLFAAPKLSDFVFSSLGACDFFTIVPFYIGLIFRLRKMSAIGIVRILRLLRIVRIFKLTRYNEGLKVVIKAVYQSGTHLRSIILIIIIMSILFASFIYFVENFYHPTTGFFVSIPDAIWYALITQTSVGYGDVYPESTAGKIVGGITAVFGLLLFCLPAPVLVNKFIECYYLRQKITEQDDPQKKAFIESMKNIYFQ